MKTILLLLSFLAASFAEAAQPDLCVVLVDSLRPDHLGCYGYERDTSPAIDAFAAGAVRFDQAIASGSWTQPLIVSMMTSVPADVHQRGDRGGLIRRMT